MASPASVGRGNVEGGEAHGGHVSGVRLLHCVVEQLCARKGETVRRVIVRWSDGAWLAGKRDRREV